MPEGSPEFKPRVRFSDASRARGEEQQAAIEQSARDLGGEVSGSPAWETLGGPAGHTVLRGERASEGRPLASPKSAFSPVRASRPHSPAQCTISQGPGAMCGPTGEQRLAAPDPGACPGAAHPVIPQQALSGATTGATGPAACGVPRVEPVSNPRCASKRGDGPAECAGDTLALSGQGKGKEPVARTERGGGPVESREQVCCGEAAAGVGEELDPSTGAAASQSLSPSRASPSAAEPDSPSRPRKPKVLS